MPGGVLGGDMGSGILSKGDCVGSMTEKSEGIRVGTTDKGLSGVVVMLVGMCVERTVGIGVEKIDGSDDGEIVKEF